MTESIDKIFLPKKYNINYNLKEAKEDSKELFEKRFIPLNNGFCYDRKVKGAWLGLCEKNWSYGDSFFYPDTPYEEVLNFLKFRYERNDIDIPTREEILNLSNIKNAPFSLSWGRPSVFQYVIYKKGSADIRTLDLDDCDYSYSDRSGYICPILRINANSIEELILELSKKGLKPKELKSQALDWLIKILSNNITDESNIINESVETYLLSLDKKRANLKEYDKKILYDVNKGSWEAYRYKNKGEVEERLEKEIIARNPKADIVEGGVVGIDFGTKSTVVVMQKDNEEIIPIRIGMGNWSKAPQPKHYENPTVMEFEDLEFFLNDYEEDNRPLTKWDDLTISHTAFANMQNASSKDLNAYFMELKQWARGNKKLKIKDKKGRIFDIGSYKEAKIDPIEIYAYYLGLYINNQYNGIFLEYLLSFPVTYEMEIREKITESFKRGLKKSIPDIGDRINELKVIAGTSEPAAYAAIVTEMLEIENKIFHGVFDFGGGTTDFDFGIFRESDMNNRKERRYDFVIEHFGAGGDRYLGGENLLAKLAFNIFKDNSDILREKNISFLKPEEEIEFLGSEILISNSQEARINTINLIERIRPFWERDEFESEIFEGGIVKVDLFDNAKNKLAEVELKIDEEKLKEILINRIKKGVDAFFESMIKAIYDSEDEIDFNEIENIYIFLAGNSSQSPIVKELFNKKIGTLKEELEKNNIEVNIHLIEPLSNDDDYTKPNAKTGVAFGLIESRPGGSILIIDRNVKEDIKFKYYLGIKRRKKFYVTIDRDSKYNKWHEFIDASNDFEIFYTSNPLAITNKMNIKEVKKLRINLKEKDEDKNIYIKLISPTTIEIGIGENENNVQSISKKELKE